MKSMAFSLMLLGALVGVARASDRIGGYATVDKVVFEPSERAPKRVQIWGSFTLVKEPGGKAYAAPVRGYLYYSAVPGKEDVCRREWADFKKVAGKGTVVGFGRSSRREEIGNLRKASQKPTSPDPYPLNFGLVKIGGRADWSPVRELLHFPAPKTPAEGARVAPGAVTLAAREVPAGRSEGQAYFFELEGGGKKEASEGITPCKGGLTWTPRMEVNKGVKYTWRVWVTVGRWKGPVAVSSFQVKVRP